MTSKPAAQSAFAPETRSPEQSAVVTWISDLVKLRRSFPALACGAEQVLFTDQDTIVYARTGAASCDPAPATSSPVPVIVAVHRGAETPLHVDLRRTAVAGCRSRSIGPNPATSSVTDDTLDLRLGTGVAILACQ